MTMRQLGNPLGFVFNEERSFFWRLSGVQNLEFFGALDNLSGAHLRDRIRYLIGLVGLQEAGDKPVSGYSSGMKQRLALARVLIAEPGRTYSGRTDPCARSRSVRRNGRFDHGWDLPQLA